ncbi:holo-ACP synthase AcpS [Corynebacterium flavescens]|uniref:Holo-[acyl-carrier-protein] synthase n=1 Tax=Corynebacterium flavescens TaxID=28028 RepID=A0A1L7CNQ2_CORFL|nr:holo-ACP synthase [Corynebacterium flavescens]APT87473.1 4'-phosphopantetheinyl transferase [Corynebacterium flavescens]KAA8720288.1 holo-ACP synthase [Corynebacterium flavescens]MDN6100081.1 holo-ACP synthase [Corynebacterium flavescens]MDN6226804.1 holo-ACP synthase [Corynebacterium flavescens]HCG46661.1 holo-ACP synthase [Corynebacterium flavescens]
MKKLAVGTDIVCIPEFAAQLAQPGSRFEAVFSPAELRVAAGKGARRAEHLAGRWAAKESFIKAWSQAIYGRPPVIAQERVIWSEVEIRPDAWGRVDIATAGNVREQVAATLGEVETSLSISHDGDYATATTILSWG